MKGTVFFIGATKAIWPVPQSSVVGGEPLEVSKDFKFVHSSQSEILNRAIKRYESYVVSNLTKNSAEALRECSITVSTHSEQLFLNASHAYTITIENSNCSISADGVYGAMYGMESFYQLASNGTLSNHIIVEDFPDFVHRGIMIDSGRRFWPVPLVKNVIEVMSFNKMNVLHLHASDMCRFGVESKLFPELTESLSGIKKGHYTQEDIKDLIAFARDRGVQILPEFDMPGHAACFIPMEPRGLEWCNKPNESPIPNWCTLKATNGTVAWKLMPQLALEMAQLFESDVYHIGGDETRCSGAGAFERMLLQTLSEKGFRTMGWSEVRGAMQPDTIIHAWKGGSNNATSLASAGIAVVDSNPSKFYRGGGKTTPASVTKAWSSLDKDSVPLEHQHLLLGGEFAFWTDAWCYINGCTRPGSGRGGGADLFGPDRDAEFTLSAGGMLWPYGHLAAGSFWKFDAALTKDEVMSRALFEHNTLAARRGGVVCPTGCTCTISSVCDEPLIPPPPPSPTPPPPKSNQCKWHSDTGIVGNDFKKIAVNSKEECCAACLANDGCEASDFNPMLGLCHLKHAFNPVWRNDGSLACVPLSQAQLV